MSETGGIVLNGNVVNKKEFVETLNNIDMMVNSALAQRNLQYFLINFNNIKGVSIFDNVCFFWFSDDVFAEIDTLVAEATLYRKIINTDGNIRFERLSESYSINRWGYLDPDGCCEEISFVCKKLDDISDNYISIRGDDNEQEAK